jgi:hypothetical protein
MIQVTSPAPRRIAEPAKFQISGSFGQGQHIVDAEVSDGVLDV